MSVCTFLATNYPLYDAPPKPGQRLSLDPTHRISNCENGSYLMAFPEASCYTAMRCGVKLDPDRSDAMVKKYIRYIETLLRETDRVEIWRVWLMDDYYEPDERPIVRRCRIALRELTYDILCELYDAKIWNNQEKCRPSFYCLEITR